MRDMAGSAAAPAARCRKFRRGSFILNPPSLFTFARSSRRRVTETIPGPDHLVGATDQWQRHCDAERLSGLHVDDQLESRGLLDRKLGRLLTFENWTCVDAEWTIGVDNRGSVTH